MALSFQSPSNPGVLYAVRGFALIKLNVGQWSSTAGLQGNESNFKVTSVSGFSSLVVINFLNYLKASHALSTGLKV